MKQTLSTLGTVIILSTATTALAAPPPKARPPRDPKSEALVEKLAKIGHQGLGYSGSVAGTQFLPLQGSGRVGMVLMGRQPPRRSTVLTKLVARGLRALPTLLQHLDDNRPIALPPIKPMMWMSLRPRVDHNRRTEKAVLRVPGQPGMPQRPRPYNVKVGDLCYVALGQILNRGYTAVRYQPTGGLVVNSPPGNPQLLAALRKRWRGLTAATHRKLLSGDFLQPDWRGRRLGAYRRLSFYYPRLAARLVLAELRRPSFDIFAASRFVRALYPLKPTQWATARATYLKRHGQHADDAIIRELYDDLDTQEAFEQKRISPRSTGAGYRAREILIRLYKRPRTVKGADPYFPRWSSQVARAGLIDGLGRLRFTAAENLALDRRLLVMMRTTRSAHLALACMKQLQPRGFHSAIGLAIIRLRPSASPSERKAFTRLRLRPRTAPHR